MTLRERKQELYRESINLRGKSYMFDDNFEMSEKIRKRQTKIYERWKFYDGYLKAKEKIK